ncbi:adenine-specific methyltransferase EcoRI family protein [Ruania zhangjianzhongii]|uniref:adenine-specific methyltransferase EcoRI family protein n=1 Tax=Ruania zhangjianzhongii TaxID=2603206 RepID=UPI0011C7C52C|nr:adenine-specific methyltransferase EcoRI family protein [Ruania zhangjianzhongii]
MASNEALSARNRSALDEWYTQLVDIEAELRHYRPQFKGKTVFCNCDDPFESNFFKFFAMNFNQLGLRKLSATSYAGSPITGQQLSLFDAAGLQAERPRDVFKVEISEVPDRNDDGAIDLSDVEHLLRHDANVMTPLKGDGDFRSREAIELLEEADVVVTNPPFSLFREFIAQLIDHGKQFLVLGDQNAAKYSSIFPLFVQNKVWFGYENGGTKWFRVPDEYTIKTKERWKIEDGVKYQSMGRVYWYTNLETTRRHQNMVLYKRYSPEEYPTYVNYDGIDVDRASDIPMDYEGHMGVPITFLDRYNPEQFEIVGISTKLAEPMAKYAEPDQYVSAKGNRVGGTGKFFVPIAKDRYRGVYERVVIRRIGGVS